MILDIFYILKEERSEQLSSLHCEQYSSAESSDNETSNVELASSTKKTDNRTRRNRHLSNINQSHLPQSTSQIKTEARQLPQQIRDELNSIATNTNLNNFLNPATLENIPQVMLMNLVQSGRLQVEEEGN